MALLFSPEGGVAEVLRISAGAGHGRAFFTDPATLLAAESVRAVIASDTPRCCFVTIYSLDD